MKIAGLTHTGRVRDHNEDAIHTDERAGLLVVADGMGGHVFGELASQLIIDTFKASPTSNDLAQTILDAHRCILDEAGRRGGTRGMGSTVVAAQCDPASYKVAWVGDSRAYLWSKSRGLRCISRDHSYLEFLLQQGTVTEEEAHTHPDRNIVTQSLGHNSPQPDSVTGPWQPGDRLLLCSDGLTDELEEKHMAEIMAGEGDVQELVNKLLHAALASGGKDNISIIIAENSPSVLTAVNWQQLLPIMAGIGAAALGAIVWFIYHS